MRTSERGEDPDTSRWRADKALAIRKSQRLRHLVGVNGFFSVLAAESRRREDCDLSLWWSEPEGRGYPRGWGVSGLVER